MAKSVTTFFTGAVFGVCVTVAIGHLHNSLRDRMPQRGEDAPVSGRRVNLALRPEERSLGDTGAPLVLVEFSDFQCPFCAQFNSVSFPEIKKRYINTGNLRFIHRNLPLPNHPSARTAALASLCANDQGAYWRLRDALFARSECLRCEGSGVLRMAETAGIDARKLEACMAANVHAGDLRSDMDSASALRIYATPSFVLGRRTATAVEGIVIEGAQPIEVFDTEIKKLNAITNSDSGAR